MLVRKFGSVDNIPHEVLEIEGFVKYKGRVVSIENLSSTQLSEALGIAELREETDERKIQKKVREVQQRVAVAFGGPIKEYLNGSGGINSNNLQQRISGGVENWTNTAYNTLLERFKNIDDLKISMVPHVQFVEGANQFLKNKTLNPAYASALLEYVWDTFLEGQSFDGSALTARYFGDAEHKYILSREETITLDVFSDEELKKDFSDKYGNPHFCSGGPFVSYAFRRKVLNEDNPVEFWGKELFELHKKLIAELGDCETVREFADLVYSEECGYAGERLFKFREDGLHGLEAITNGLPKVVQDFERLRTHRGAAIAFIEAKGYHIDTDYLSDNQTLRDLLKAVHEAEFGVVTDNQLDHYTFLDAFVKNQGKKLKIARLCNQSSEFRKLVDAYCQGNSNYVDSLEGNIRVNRELRDLGVKVDTFYQGIEPKEFIVASGKIINREQLRQEQLSLYRQTMQNVFTSGIVHGTDRLEQKIADAFKGNETFSPVAEQLISEYVAGLEDDGVVRKICHVTIEYLSKKQNVKQSQQAAAAIHHLKIVSKFMHGEHIDEISGEMNKVYQVKVSSKNPFIDVDIGNDGGCCIGIYEQGDFERDVWTPKDFISYLQRGEGKELERVEENGCYIPFYLKDRATQFVEIYTKQDRAGMALIFAGRNENHESCLLVNSIELSERLKQDGNRKMVIDETIQFIQQYATACGFTHVLMGGHSYNPARNCSSELVEFNLEKIHCWNEPFYSDVLNSEGKNNGIWRRL